MRCSRYISNNRIYISRSSSARKTIRWKVICFPILTLSLILSLNLFFHGSRKSLKYTINVTILAATKITKPNNGKTSLIAFIGLHKSPVCNASMPEGKPAVCLYLLQRKPSPPKPLQLTEPQERQPVITGGLSRHR